MSFEFASNVNFCAWQEVTVSGKAVAGASIAIDNADHRDPGGFRPLFRLSHLVLSESCKEEEGENAD